MEVPVVGRDTVTFVDVVMMIMSAFNDVGVMLLVE